MYIEQVHTRGCLGMIFVDEIHMVIIDVVYRAALQGLGELHYYNQPLVLLTATLLLTLAS